MAEGGVVRIMRDEWGCVVEVIVGVGCVRVCALFGRKGREGEGEKRGVRKKSGRLGDAA